MVNQHEETSVFSIFLEGSSSSIVSFGFKSAVESDIIWEQFLPHDYKDIIAGSSSPVVYSSKKELYFLLCDSPILLHEGKMSFWLDKVSGKKCYMLSARELQILRADTPKCWKWTSLPESRFSEVAKLLNILWLEILGEIQAHKLSPNTNYTAYLVYKVAEENYGLDYSSKATTKFFPDQNVGETSTVYLVPPKHPQVFDGRIPTTRSDGWWEIELGEFFNGDVNCNEIRMHLLVGNSLHWKKGLIVEGIEVRPKE